MNNPCTDRDLLALEPVLFLGGLGGAVMAGGAGEMDGTTFSVEGLDFEAAQVRAGDVLACWKTAPSEGECCEVVEVLSATSLKVSVLRETAGDDAIAPPAGEGLSFAVRSYRVAIAQVWETLCERVRQVSRLAGAAGAEFADEPAVRRAVAYGALASIFATRAAGAGAMDANWAKVAHYERLFVTASRQLRLNVDFDGDGVFERAASLAYASLRRD